MLDGDLQTASSAHGVAFGGGGESDRLGGRKE